MVEIRGGKGQKVAIILTPEMKAGINLITRKYMHAETLALLTKPLYFPNMKF